MTKKVESLEEKVKPGRPWPDDHENLTRRPVGMTAEMWSIIGALAQETGKSRGAVLRAMARLVEVNARIKNAVMEELKK